ncbi:MAG: hypothetical protein L3J16_04815 [Anaerolineales bacterium]|nr:hypothetical protein [Anaerolineales bacterium]
MDNNHPNQYVFREYPIPFVLMGLLGAGGGIYLSQKSGTLTLTAGIILAVSLLPFFFASILDVNADRPRRDHADRRQLCAASQRLFQRT